MKRVAFVFPTMWDEKQLPACQQTWATQYEVELAAPTDAECPWDLDVTSYIDEAVKQYRGGLDGIASSSDYPGATVAAAIATRLGLPGSAPQDVIRCSHKYYSRLAQKEIVPEATAKFHLVAPNDPAEDITFPCFIKPVKGAFSIMSQRIRDRGELEAFLKNPTVSEFVRDYVFIFNCLVRELTELELDGSYFLAEELLTGKQATVEGYVTDGEVRILGIVDSIRHPQTKSFVRFDYPSSLSRAIQARMADITLSLVTHLGLQQTLFNIEMMVNERKERISIVEVNPRMCGQFGDLYAKVDGTSGYEVALSLAAGQTPRARHDEGAYGAASSNPLRIFEHRRVARAPSSSELAEVEAEFPDTLVWSECNSGDELSDFESSQDGKSSRYAVVNVGARDRKTLSARLDEVVRSLDYRFEPL
jgi:biotin carboxylase